MFSQTNDWADYVARLIKFLKQSNIQLTIPKPWKYLKIHHSPYKKFWLSSFPQGQTSFP